MSSQPDILLEEAIAQNVLAKAISKEVFNKEFGDLKTRLGKQEGLSYQVILGALVATVLIFVGLMVQVSLFISDYDKRTADMESLTNQNIQSLLRDKADMEMRLMRELDQLKAQVSILSATGTR